MASKEALEILIEMMKFDELGLLSLPGEKYGAYYKGSWWTDKGPKLAGIKLLIQYPNFRFKKGQTHLSVKPLDEVVPGVWGANPDKYNFDYTWEEVQKIKKAMV